MTSPIRFAAAHARMHALKARLWTPLDRQLVAGAGIAPDGRHIRGEPDAIYPELVRWYATYLRIYPGAGGLWRALFRRHEVENLKLLWRAAVRGRVAPAGCWRPLAPLAVLTRATEPLTPADLVRQLEGTPYAGIARALLRSHAADLPAAEIGLDRWVWSAVADWAAQLPPAERAAARLVRALVIEHDAELLRRGISRGLEPDLVAKSTVVLSRECRLGALTAAAAWREGDGPLVRVLPASLARGPAVLSWAALTRALRAARLRQCRRAFVGWPFTLGPAIAALLLREEQAHAAASIGAARARGPRAFDPLGLALAASALES